MSCYISCHVTCFACHFTHHITYHVMTHCMSCVKSCHMPCHVTCHVTWHAISNQSCHISCHVMCHVTWHVTCHVKGLVICTYNVMSHVMHLMSYGISHVISCHILHPPSREWVTLKLECCLILGNCPYSLPPHHSASLSRVYVMLSCNWQVYHILETVNIVWLASTCLTFVLPLC